jgi:hypothetical protein
MRGNLPRIVFVLSSAFILLAQGCSDREQGGRWEAFLMGLPDEVTTARAVETDTYYILKQTHEPLFRLDDGENYHSRVLTEWRKDISSKQYLFCPDTSQKFNRTEYFSLEFFGNYLKKVTGRYSSDFVVKQQGKCFSVTFTSPHKSYLNFLTLYENAPTLRQSDKIEMGLGAFYVSELGKGKIVLRRKASVHNGYSEVILNEYSPGKADSYDYGKISDFNKIALFDVPDNIIKNYFGFYNIELRSDVLIINHPDIEVRKRVYNCLDVDKFRRAFFPKKNDFLDIQNILPLGVLGAVPGLPVQKCDYRTAVLPKKRELVLFNHRTGNIEQLDAIAKKFRSCSGLTLKVISRPPSELGPLMHKSPRPYNMAVIAISTVSPDYKTFLGYIVRPSGYFDSVDPKLKGIFAEIERETDPDMKGLYVAQFLKELQAQYLVLPLYQNVKKLYYPKKIKNLNVGREFMEYPEVADFIW